MYSKKYENLKITKVLCTYWHLVYLPFAWDSNVVWPNIAWPLNHLQLKEIFLDTLGTISVSMISYDFLHSCQSHIELENGLVALIQVKLENWRNKFIVHKALNYCSCLKLNLPQVEYSFKTPILGSNKMAAKSWLPTWW
jgi:hypothetical protein